MSKRRLVPILLLPVLTFHLWVMGRFHALDQRLPDGDVMGHLGAIELFAMVHEDRGLGQALWGIFSGPGEYPPLYALMLGLQTSLGPGAAPFPTALSPGLMALWAATFFSVYLLGTRVGDRWTGLMAASLYSIAPLATGLAHFPMPENGVTLWLTLSAWALLGTQAFRRTGWSALAGVFLALGLLTKQTFALYALPMVLQVIWSAWRRPDLRRDAALGFGVTALLALPIPTLWFALHLGEQGGYLGASAGSGSQAPVWHHLIYYPLVLSGHALGPLLTGLGAARWLRRDPGEDLTLRWGWVLPLMLLTAIPKKYPRLVAPLLPLLVVDVADGLRRAMKRRPRTWGRALPAVLSVVMLLGGYQIHQQALAPQAEPTAPGIWIPDLVVELDPGAFQTWIEPAHPHDMALDSLRRLLAARLPPGQAKEAPPPGKGRLLFVDAPTLPPSYQTTFAYPDHVARFLQRRGIEPGEIGQYTQDTLPESALQDRWLELVITTQPWACPGEAPPIPCAGRPAFEVLPTLHSDDPTLPFVLHIYGKNR